MDAIYARELGEDSVTALRAIAQAMRFKLVADTSEVPLGKGKLTTRQELLARSLLFCVMADALSEESAALLRQAQREKEE